MATANEKVQNKIKCSNKMFFVTFLFSKYRNKNTGKEFLKKLEPKVD